MEGLAVGRIVHVHDTGVVLAAVVTDIEDEKTGRVRLSIFTGNKQAPIEVRKNVEYAKGPALNCWSWPVKDEKKK